MAGRRPETMAKRARELAVKEKRDRKRAKKAEVAALRLAGVDPYATPPEETTPDETTADGVAPDEPAAEPAGPRPES
jgi:hypothetical protein